MKSTSTKSALTTDAGGVGKLPIEFNPSKSLACISVVVPDVI